MSGLVVGSSPQNHARLPISQLTPPTSILTQISANSDHTVEQSQAAVTLKEADYSNNEKFSADRLSESESSPSGGLDHPVHPTHDADGNVWVYPAPEDLAGPHALRRVVDKMYVLA